MEYTVIKYSPGYYTVWNEFVQQSKNGTFLFHRDFMEYHSDRFTDYSLLVFSKNKLVALLPANIDNDIVHSHQGLTYGGLVYNDKLRLENIIHIFRAVLNYFHNNDIKELIVKDIPAIYHRQPAQDLQYCLFITNAQLIRRDALQVINGQDKIKIAANRLEGVKKARALQCKVTPEDDFSDFWNMVLEPGLIKKHKVKPVHSLKEITYLKNKFPDNIKLYTVRDNGIITAGTVLFETATVVHAQYIFTDGETRKTGSLDFLYYTLITDIYKHKKFFDFGTSNENQGRSLNAGLAFWKETFGGRTIIQDFYKVAPKNYTLLDNVLI